MLFVDGVEEVVFEAVEDLVDGVDGDRELGLVEVGEVVEVDAV